MEQSSYIDLSLHQHSNENKNNNILESSLELFMQELEIAVKMMPADVWGIKNFLDINKYVFSQYVTLSQVINDITDYVIYNCQHASYHQWHVNAEFVEVENKDFLHIMFSIQDINESGISEEFKVKFLFGT